MTPHPLYLHTNQLWPCDVLLTRGAAKESRWIAWLTLGSFSHAAVVVNRSVLFESEDLGVGYTQLRTDRVERHSDERRLMSVLEGVDRAVVLRHPRLTQQMATDLEDDLIEALYPAFGQEYPPWADLATALPGGPVVRMVGRLVLKAKDAFGGEKVWNPGPFCSQIVAKALMDVFKKKNIALFDRERSPGSVHPNAFLKSALRPVPLAVGPADSSATLDHALLAQLQAHIVTQTREESTGSLVRTKIQATKNIEKADEIIAAQKKRIDR
jgi:hypothetical protein